MNCNEVDAYLASVGTRSGAVPDDNLRAHLNDCTQCQQILEWQIPEQQVPSQDPALTEKLREILKRDLKPVRPLARLSHICLALLALSVTVPMGYWLTMGMAGWLMLSHFQRIVISAYAVGALSLVCGSLYWSINPGSLARYSPRWSVAAILGALPLLALQLLPMQPGNQFFVHGWPCFVASFALFFPTAAITIGIVRKGFALDSSTAGVLVGAFGALIAGLALQFACPYQEAAHLLLWHGGAVLVAIILGHGLVAKAIVKLQAA